jgi:hypothetical protein
VQCKRGQIVNSDRSGCTSPQCTQGRVPSPTGKCVCSGRSYDTSLHGILICNAGDWEPAEDDRTYQDAQKLRSEGSSCVPCPTDCVACENGTATLREGWRLSASSLDAIRVQLMQEKDGQPQHIFSCPYSETDCPPIKLLDTQNTTYTARISCLGNHAGPLCAICKGGFSRRGSSDNRCEGCKDIADYVLNKFGLPVEWFAALLVAIGLVACGVIYLGTTVLAKFWVVDYLDVTKPNQRILLGSAQVLSLLPSVLELIYPPQPKAAMSYAALMTADLRNVLRVECWGWSWYDKWLASVLGMPALAVLPVAIYWLKCRFSARKMDSHGREQEHNEARKTSVGALFFVAMLLYPQLSASILSVLRCRRLGEELKFLEADYSINCTSQHYSNYRSLALVLVVIVPIGFPIGLLAALLHQKDGRVMTNCDSLSQQLLSTPEAEGAEPPEPEPAENLNTGVKDLIRDLASRDYRAECFWFEPVDLLRKLFLSGLLQFVHRGTAAQCFCGSAISFASFGVQQWLRPYKDDESNALKALVDTQLFLTFLISFILRVLPEINSAEPFGVMFYGWLLLCTMVVLVVSAIGLTAVQVRRYHRSRQDNETNTRAVTAVQDPAPSRPALDN